MSKKSIVFSVIIIFILLVSVLGVFQITKNLAGNSNKEITRQLMSEDEKRSLNLYRLGNYEVVSRDTSGKIASYRFLNLKELEPVALEWMTDEEKAKRELDASVKAQILERDGTGKIVSYKIVVKESDIISKY